MNVKIEEANGLTIAEISGDLDGKTTLPIQKEITAAVKPDSHCVVDMSKVGYMSSAGLRLLLVLQRQLNAKGKLVISGLSEQIKDTMTVTGFLELFVITETLAEAKALVA